MTQQFLLFKEVKGRTIRKRNGTLTFYDVHPLCSYDLLCSLNSTIFLGSIFRWGAYKMWEGFCHAMSSSLCNYVCFGLRVGTSNSWFPREQLRLQALKFVILGVFCEMTVFCTLQFFFKFLSAKELKVPYIFFILWAISKYLNREYFSSNFMWQSVKLFNENFAVLKLAS